MHRSIWLLLVAIYAVYGFPKPPYCQAPGVNPSEDTDGMTLQFLQILTRHGDRTPTFAMPSEVTWNCTLNFLSVPGVGFEDLINTPPRLYRKEYLPNRNVLPGDCFLGQLTTVGLEQHLELGAGYRALYVDTYQLLPPVLDLDDIWIRSTDVPRTIQSVQANLWNFFPPTNRTDGHTNVIPIHTMDIYEDDMTPNSNICPGVAIVEDRMQNTSEYVQWNATQSAVVEYVAKVFNVSANDLPSVLGLWDAFGARMCHNLEIPPQISYEILTEIESLASTALNNLWSNSEYGRLGSGMLLQELNNRINDFISGKDSPSLVYYSGHDTTVGPLMGTLGITNGWPPYASHVEIELWADSSMNNYVQVKYNGQSYQLPTCPGYMCPIATFQNFVSTRIPTNFQKECLIPSLKNKMSIH